MEAKGEVLVLEGVPELRATDSVAASHRVLLEVAIADHSRLLYRVAFAVLRNHHDAEDAVQECFMKALRYGRQLATVENRAAWLARITWRVALDRRSKSHTVAWEDAAAEVRVAHSSGLSADQLAISREMGALLTRLIEHLPRRLREPLLLSTIEELSAREVGEILGIPAASVRSRCLQARQLLKAKLVVLMEAPYGH